MLKETQKLFFHNLETLAKLNGVDYVMGSSGLNFAVDPTVEQKLEKRVQERADFLSRINVIPVRDLTGEKVLLEANSTIASRTDTDANDRQTADPTDENPDTYLCAKTDFDTHLKYQKLDIWSKFPNFQQRWRDVVIDQMARDRLMIGFNGTSRAANTDRVANPLLQDVNIGWTQKLRDANSGSQHVASQSIGATGDEFNNVDAMVLAMVGDLIDPWHRTATDLVCIAGRNIVSDKYVSLVNDNGAPTERVALQTLMTNKNLGGLPTFMVPFFPEDAVLITRMEALSIYWQEGSRRRTIVDNAKRDRVEDYQSVNEDYVIEDRGACAFVEGITIATP